MQLFFPYFAFFVENGVTPINAIIAGLAFLNTLGIFGLIYHVGEYIGRNNERWLQAEKSLNSVPGQQLMQAKMEAMLLSMQATLETSRSEMRKAMDQSREEMKAEVKSLRRRSHDLSNVITRIVLERGANLTPPLGENGEHEG